MCAVRSGCGCASCGSSCRSPKSSTGTASIPAACSVLGDLEAASVRVQSATSASTSSSRRCARERRERRIVEPIARERVPLSSVQHAIATQRSPMPASSAHGNAPCGTAPRVAVAVAEPDRSPSTLVVEQPRRQASRSRTRPARRRGRRRGRCGGGRAAPAASAVATKRGASESVIVPYGPTGSRSGQPVSAL